MWRSALALVLLTVATTVRDSRSLSPPAAAGVPGRSLAGPAATSLPGPAASSLPGVGHPLGAPLGAAGPEPYELVTRTGEVVPVSEIADTATGYLLRTQTGSLRLAPGSSDFYATFRRNHERGHGGNVLWFLGGRFMRFESLAFEAGGRLRLHLGEEAVVKLPEQIVDFEATVLESGPTLLPRGRGQLLIAKSTGPPPPERPAPPEPVDAAEVPEPSEAIESDAGLGTERAPPSAQDLGRSSRVPNRGLGNR